MEIVEISTVIGAIGGLGLLQWWYTRRQTKLLAQTQADNAKTDAAKNEFHFAQEVVDFYKKENERLRGVVDKQQEIIDDKTARIRKGQDDLLASERKLNRANERLIKAEKRIAELEIENAYLIDWHCRIADCDDRRPPNKKLTGLKFDPSRLKRETTSYLTQTLQHETK